jgi:phosphopantothenoylcysteine decarboxylase / phosphopantothenate---cysteine ligase
MMAGPPGKNLAGTKVLFGVSGGIAAYKAVELLRLLIKAGAEVQVVLTATASRFVAAETLAVLSRRPVLSDLFDRTPLWHVPHVQAAAWADIVLLAPATANLIGKMANGLGDDMLSTLMLGVSCPVVVAPAMEEHMLDNPAVEANMDLLRQRGAVWVDPEEGELASGSQGRGRLAALDVIFTAVEMTRSQANDKDLDGLRLLVSAGPTVEDIDPVRFISNRSSGKMGYAIAQRGISRGAQVVLVSGPTALKAPTGADWRPVRSTLEMKAELEGAFDWCEAAVLAAAVADYRVAEVASEKIKRGDGGLRVELVENPDIAASLGRRKGQRIVVPFALETSQGVERARAKLKRKGGDFIVLNDLGEPGVGFEVDTNAVTLIDSSDQVEVLPLQSKQEVADHILDRILGLWRPS